ncbi:MAG: EAL domain-containing protein [Hyphomicrobiaceae bacterium]
MSGYQLVSLPAGEVLFRENDNADCAYVVDSGTLEISVMRNGVRVVIATVGAREILGEMAILTNQRRSATAVALDDCVLQKIEAEQFTRRVFEMDPVMRMTIETVLNRLRKTIKMLETSTGKPTNIYETPSNLAPAALESLKLESDIATALRQDQMRIHYHPIIHLDTGTLCGFEALVRWQHPERGLIAPDQFIPTANESALIRQVTSFCVRQACTDLPKLRTACLKNIGKVAPVITSINVTGRDLESGNLVDDIEAAVTRNGLTPDVLTFEITESSLMRDTAMAARVLAEIRELGSGVAIDDFGTGYSSISHLTRLPATTIKIDRSFVAAMNNTPQDRKIVTTIVRLAKDLGMSVIAEGIETVEDLTFLKENGCDFGQGFLFTEPMPLVEAVAFVESWNGATHAVPAEQVRDTA